MDLTTELPPSYRRLFAIDGFTRLVTSMMLGRTAGSMVSLILVLFALDRYQSATVAGLATFLSIAPGLVAAPVAGALLDRHGRTRLIVLDYVVAACAFTAVAALDAVGLLPVPLLLLIVTIASLTFPLSNVGMRTLFPVLVPRRLWERANAIDSNGYVVSSIFGPAAAGALVASVGAGWALVVTASVSALAALVATGIRDPSERGTQGRLLADAWAGLVYVGRNPSLRGLGLAVSTSNLGSGIFFLALPVLVLQRLGESSAIVGELFALMGVAGAVSVIFVGRLNSEGRERPVLAGSMLASGLGMLAVLLFPNLLAVALAMAFIGASAGPFDVTMFTLRQRRTDPAWLGRAFAVSMAANFGGFPLGSALGGAVIPLSLELAFLLAAAFGAAGALIALVAIPARAEPYAL